MSFRIHRSSMKEVSQALLQMKQQATTVENAADSFIPLTDAGTQERFLAIKEAAVKIRKDCQVLYEQVAPDAFNGGPSEN